MPRLPEEHRRCVSAALRALGVDNLVLQIHGPSLPSEPTEDVGRGTPYSRGGRAFFELAQDLGFTGAQLGPQGETLPDSPSPYDSTAFSRNPSDVSLSWLAERHLLREETMAALVRGPASAPGRANHRFAAQAARTALDEAFATFRQGGSALFSAFLEFKRRQSTWLDRDVLYGPLAAEHGAMDFRDWPGIDSRLFTPRPGEEAACAERLSRLRARFSEAIERYAFGQFVVHAQHDELKAGCAAAGLKLYGDLQIGLALQDVWSRQRLFLASYAMGAPPSRTNPGGQPWGYPVLDPEQLGPPGSPGPARRLVALRLEKLFDEFDGVRLDHPHGLVCPWVYRREDPDPLHAVQRGARLFDSPDLPDHPELARFAIPRPEQLDRSAPRYADGWVRELEPAQVDLYARLFDAVVAAARSRGRAVSDLVCEVLSTQPLPLRRVMERHGLGRFRVTQKVDLDDPADVYRTENAAPEDWVMVGNHDTPPIWLVAERWRREGSAARHAAYLAERLVPPGGDREGFIRSLEADPNQLAHAKLADLFTSRARSVMIFFSDLFGLREVYNDPGTVSELNWTLRLGPGYGREYQEARLAGRALNLPRALALALRARGGNGELAAALERLAAR